MTMEIKKIDSVTVRVRDAKKAAAFYTQVLGLPEIWSMQDGNSRGYGVGDNSATLNILQEPSRESEVVIHVEDVTATREELERKGVRFDDPTFTIPEIGKAAHFRDPDGNRFMLLDYSIEHAREAAGT